MRILLVYPEMPDTFWVLRHFLKLTGKKSLYPPLGLLTVAAMLPKEWEKRLVDTNLRPLTDEDLTWPDYVFLSAMNVQEPSARQIIAHCREAGVKVVAGGPLFTHEYLQFNDIAHFVLNEAELTLPQFLKDLEQGEPEPVYQSDEYANVHETPI
ncbi:MAG: B12-binding domain-containing radical SAM protein, partial [Candidatus Latescibacteria bacterium]|nr:B12-binding domain-containing radical SAM protein [Candidatus Latescibacterota bacterium]